MEHTYKSTNGPTEEEMKWIPQRIADRLVKLLETNLITKITTEDVIESFRMLNDDYDDWWARGLITIEQEKEFVYDLLDRLEKYDIFNVEDNTFI